MDLPTDMLIIPPPHDQSKDLAIMKIVNNQKIHRYAHVKRQQSN